MQAETTGLPDLPGLFAEELAGEGESVGCLGRITYPIEAQFEKFLADRVQLRARYVGQGRPAAPAADLSTRNRRSTAKARRICGA